MHEVSDKLIIMFILRYVFLWHFNKWHFNKFTEKIKRSVINTEINSNEPIANIPFVTGDFCLVIIIICKAKSRLKNYFCYVEFIFFRASRVVLAQAGWSARVSHPGRTTQPRVEQCACAEKAALPHTHSRKATTSQVNKKKEEKNNFRFF